MHGNVAIIISRAMEAERDWWDICPECDEKLDEISDDGDCYVDEYLDWIP